MLFHCLFCHMYTRKDRDKGYWDLSCDIAMEYVIDGLYQNVSMCREVPLGEKYISDLRRLCPEKVRDPDGWSGLTGPFWRWSFRTAAWTC